LGDAPRTPARSGARARPTDIDTEEHDMPKDTTKPAARKPRTARVRRVAAKAPAKRATAPAPVTHEQIALRAYELHVAGTEGDAMAHWLRAERELVGA
jgi:hypothetical protein